MNEEEMSKDLFGFLPCEWTLEFDGGRISPVQGFHEVETWVDKYIHEDGFLYPPMTHQAELDPSTMEVLREVPKTERPAILHRIPPSHELLLLSASGTGEDMRRGPASFLIHLLAYLFGIRLQFYDWWFDGRVPIQKKARTHNIHFTKEVAEDFLGHSYGTWRSWPAEAQKLITNILYMHSRAPSYEWDWEQFIIEYMAFDGCWNLAELVGFVQKERVSQKKKFEILCTKFQIPIRADLVQEFVRLRNDLFHEALWDRSQPCTTVSNTAFMSVYHLRRLNQRIIPAVLGYNTAYVQSGWWFLGSDCFCQPSGK